VCFEAEEAESRRETNSARCRPTHGGVASLPDRRSCSRWGVMDESSGSSTGAAVSVKEIERVR